MTRIFLSYARGDDGDSYDPSTSFVARLHSDLAAAGFDVWFDRVSLPSRQLTFHQEIADAIRSRDRLILVVGPKAAHSEYVRQEWRWALELDKCVVPILRKGDYPHIPGELGLLHCADFRNDAQYAVQVAKLIEDLRQPVPPLGALFGMPNLPPHFLGRPELLRRIKDALLVDLLKPVVITGGAARIGVQGMGGIGKSVLAAALARDPDVRRSYPDGIVWVAVGQHPDCVRLQHDLARYLGCPEQFQSEVHGLSVLRRLFAQKAILLVLDDVWDAHDALAFDVLGPRCRALVTTRDAAILHAMGGESVPVSLFTESEALQLLAEAVGLDRDALPPTAREVVKECGCLPLAIALCGGMAKKRHGDWDAILQRLRRADLEKISDREAINEQHQSIWRAMQVSVEVLKKEEQQRFVELSVFATERPVTEAAIATLWKHTGNLDELDTLDLIINLSERSLIHLDQKVDAAGRNVERRISLHDLVYDFATRLAGEPRVLHQTLLDAYRKRCPNGWSSGPDDGYFFQHLPRHLTVCSCWDDLLVVVRSPAFSCIKRWVDQGETTVGVECLAPLVEHLFQRGRGNKDGSALASQLARIYMQRGETALAEKQLQQAIHALPFWRDLRTKAIAWHELGSIRLQFSDYDNAAILFRRALRICSVLGRRHIDEAAANLLALSTIHLERYQYADSIRMARKALDYSLTAGDGAHVVAAHRILATAFKDTLNYPDAEFHLQAAFSFAEADGLLVEKLSVQIVMGWTNYTRSVLDGYPIEPAFACFRAVMTDALIMHNENFCIESGLGLIWCELFAGNAKAAQKQLNEILAVREPSHHTLSMLLALGRAKVEHENGKLDSARNIYESLAQASQKASKLGIYADSLAGFGSILRHSGSPGEGEALWAQALSIAGACSPARRSLVEKSISEARTNASCSPR